MQKSFIKKLLIFVLAFFLLAGCSNNEKNVEDELSSESTLQSDTIKNKYPGVETGVLQTSEYYDDYWEREHNYMITSPEELRAFMLGEEVSWSDYMYYEERSEHGQMSVFKKIDFEKYTLFFTMIESSTGSREYTMESINIEGDTVELNYSYESPEIVTDDMAMYYPYAIIPKELLTEEEYEGWTRPIDKMEETMEEFYASISDEALQSCLKNPSYEEYYGTPIVYLASYGESIDLYGIRDDKRSVMLLTRNDEKIIVKKWVENDYGEMPKLNYIDIDEDGVEEFVISEMTVSGEFADGVFSVCDYEQEQWNTYVYNREAYREDIKSVLQLEYHKDTNQAVLKYEDRVIKEMELPSWVKEYAVDGNSGYDYAVDGEIAYDYAVDGEMGYDYDVFFDAEALQLIVKTELMFGEDVSVQPMDIVFNVEYLSGQFSLGDYTVVENEVIDLTKYLNQYPDKQISRPEYMVNEGQICMYYNMINVDYSATNDRGQIEYFLIVGDNHQVQREWCVDYAELGIEKVSYTVVHWDDVTGDGKKDIVIEVYTEDDEQYEYVYDLTNNKYELNIN